MGTQIPLKEVVVSAYRVPTAAPEADGTLSWDATEVTVVQARAGGAEGLGYTYTSSAAAHLVEEVLAGLVLERDVMDIPAMWRKMVDGVRNIGRPGLASMAIAAVDCALWDLKARILEMPLARLFGEATESVPIYASGGLTSLSTSDLVDQAVEWVDAGTPRFKMKIGTDWGTKVDRDLARVASVRGAVGPKPDLMVDANGAYRTKQAVGVAKRLDDLGVSWFEEPVSSDHLDGLRLIRSCTGLEVAAGEYGHDHLYAERMCQAGAVDVLQADVTRCAGFSEWLRVAAVAGAHGLEISSHCAPALHVHVLGAVPNARHLEYFVEHARVEKMLFDGVPQPVDGKLSATGNGDGNGMTLKDGDLGRWRVL